MIIEYRGYQIKPYKEVPTSYVVVTAGRGGKIPAILDTLFTRVDYAKQAIDSYVDAKENKSDKTDNKG